MFFSSLCILTSICSLPFERAISTRIGGFENLWIVVCNLRYPNAGPRGKCLKQRWCNIKFSIPIDQASELLAHVLHGPSYFLCTHIRRARVQEPHAVGWSLLRSLVIISSTLMYSTSNKRHHRHLETGFSHLVLSLV